MGAVVLLGVLFSGLISGLAYSRGSLSSSGALTALVVGTIIYVYGSLFWYGLLLGFFISSSLWSGYKRRQKSRVEDLFDKTGRRDAIQVVANGGIGALLTLLYHLHPSMNWIVAYVGVMATVNADTWGTEIGVLSKNAPVHILRWRRVEKGTSGGVSGLGMVGTGTGALFIGLLAAFFYWIQSGHIMVRFVLIGTVAGVIGALVDSILGATFQRMFVCEVCQQETEKAFHCDYPARNIRGYSWCTNDAVNLISSVAGGSVAYYFSKLI